jgi:hypothetical protein
MIMTRHGKAEPQLRRVMFCARTENSRPPGVVPELRPEASRGASLPRHAIVEGARNTIAPSGSSEAQRPCCSTASAVGLVQSGLSRRKGRPRNDPGCDRSVLLRLHLSEGAIILTTAEAVGSRSDGLPFSQIRCLALAGCASVAAGPRQAPNAPYQQGDPRDTSGMH